jgi:hypothetical protein
VPRFRDEVSAIVATAQDGPAEVRADPSPLEQGAMDEATRLIAEYGAKVCGSDDG